METPLHPHISSPIHVLTPTKGESSNIYKYEVRVVCNEKHMWICLAGECRENGGCKVKIRDGTTSNATAHLSSVHNLTSNKTLTYQHNIKQINQKLDIGSPGYNVDPARWYPINISKLAAWKSIPYNAFEGDSFKILTIQFLFLVRIFLLISEKVKLNYM
jgi:hypothetical protein